MNKKLFLIGLFLMFGFFMLISSNDVSATIHYPQLTDNIFAGTENITFTIIEDVENNTLFNISIEGYSPSTGNSSWVLLVRSNAFGLNYTLNNTGGAGFTMNYDTTQLDDSDDYYIRINLTNATFEGVNLTYISPESVTNSSIRIDNTIPGDATSLSPADDSTDTDGDVTFSANISSKSSTHCYLNFLGRFPQTKNYNSNQIEMTEAGDTCSLTLYSIPEQRYKWYVTSTDNTNNSEIGSIYNLIIDKSTGIGKGAAFEEELRKGTMEKTKEGFYVIKEKKPLSLATITETEYLGVPTLGWIIIVIIVGSLLYVYYKKK